MKGKGGFTLIELLVVLALMAILAAIGFNLNGWENKFSAEAQAKQAYSDLMNARQTAVTQKRMVFVQFTNKGYKAYADTFPPPDGSGVLNTTADTMLVNATVNGQVTMKNNPPLITISSDGLLSPTGSIYFSSGTSPQLNCLEWTETSMSLGLWNGTKNDCDIN